MDEAERGGGHKTDQRISALKLSPSSKTYAKKHEIPQVLLFTLHLFPFTYIPLASLEKGTGEASVLAPNKRDPTAIAQL